MLPLLVQAFLGELPGQELGPIPTSAFVLAQGGFDFLPLVLIFVVFYFVLIRPASKERKTREAAVKALKQHDRVITNAGIHGTVVRLEDDAVVLRVDDKTNCRMKFTRQSVWQVLPQESKAATTPSEAAS